MFNDTEILLNHVLPVVYTVVDNLKLTVTQTIDLAVGAVDFTTLTTLVFPPMTAMAVGLDSTQVNMLSLLKQGDNVTIALGVLVSLSKILTSCTIDF